MAEWLIDEDRKSWIVRGKKDEGIRRLNQNLWTMVGKRPERPGQCLNHHG
jgi:hypothetical protein